MFSTRIRADSSFPCWKLALAASPRIDDEPVTYFEKLGHCSPLLLGDGCVLLLHHAKPADGQLELDLNFALLEISARPIKRFGD